MAFTGQQILEAHANRHDGGRRLIWSKLSDKEQADLLEAVRVGPSRADLSDANLGGADLIRAYLREANLRRAYLRDAILIEAEFSGANLIGAILSGANLRRANLSRANLSRANLSGADLSGVDLSGVDLSGANLSGAYLRGAILPAAPKVEDLDGQILRLVESGRGGLEMGYYHTCQTTHCRSGWAVHLAGDEGLALEEQYGPSVAGALIYHASTGHVPDFHATNESAMADIRERVEAA